jgi:hypothetical protein
MFDTAEHIMYIYFLLRNAHVNPDMTLRAWADANFSVDGWKSSNVFSRSMNGLTVSLTPISWYLPDKSRST